MLITDCPCAAEHEMTEGSWRAFERVTRNLNPDVIITTGLGSWKVPRIYIACHGITTPELPELARRYGFPQLAP